MRRSTATLPAKIAQAIDPDLKRILAASRYVVQDVHGIFAFERIPVNRTV